MAELRSQPPVTEKITGAALRRRQQIFMTLRQMAIGRQAARHRYVWPALRSGLPDGPEQVSRLVDQKRRIEEILIELRWFGDRDPAVNDITAQLLDCLDEHLSTEAEVMARLETIIGRQAVHDLEEAASRAQQFAPRRPHPNQPAAHPVVATLFRPIAIVDRVIDAVEFGPSGS